MPRVTLLTPHRAVPGGGAGRGERYTTNVARAIARTAPDQWQVELVTYGREASREQLEPGLVSRVIRADNKSRHRDDSLSWELQEVLDGADVVHVYGPFTHGGAMAVAVGAALHLPLGVTDQEFDSMALGREVYAVELGDVVIAHSKTSAARVPTRNPVELVPVGVDVDFFSPPDPRAARAGVLFVDDPVMELGPEAVRALLARDEHLTVMEPRAGRIDELRLRDHYRSALVTVVGTPTPRFSPLTPEWLGMIVLESMACATPVICPDQPAMRDYVQHGTTGWLVAGQQELERSLAAALSDPDGTASVGSSARRWVQDEWDLGSAGARLANIYAGLVR